MRFPLLVVLCLAVGGLVCALSQRHQLLPQPLQFYDAADSLYDRALKLSTTKNYNEKEEARLNRLALENFQRYFESVQKLKLPKDTAYFFAAIKSGELAHYFDNLPQALQHYNNAVGLRDKNITVADSFFFKPYILAGLIYINQNKLDSATDYLKKAEAIQDKSRVQLAEGERLFNLLGGIYYEYGNYGQARNYFQKASEVLSANNPSYKELYVNYRVNLATALYKLEEYDAANKIYLDLLQKNAYLKNQINNNLGLIQLSLGAPKQAITYLKKVKYESALAGGLYNDLSNAYFNLNQPDSSQAYLERALRAHRQYNNDGLSLDYGRTLKLYGDLKRSLGQLDTALVLYQQALHQFYPAFADTEVTVNPVVFSGAFSYINLFQALVAKADAQEALYEKTVVQEKGIQSLNTYKAAFRLLDYVERTYESDEARLFLSRIKYAVHSKPIDLAFSLYHATGNNSFLETLYTFDQQNKAAVLALNHQRNTTEAQSGDATIKKEQALKREITRLSIKAAQAADSTLRNPLSRQIRDLEIALSKLQGVTNNNRLSREDNLPSLHELQTNLLDEKTALLSYHLSPQKLTTFIVSKKRIDCYQQTLPADFTDNFLYDIRLLKTGASLGSLRRNPALWTLFLQHVSLPGLQQLVIIPDDVLAYFPFECLQDSAGKFLIEDVAVQYQFSTALLKKNKLDFSTAQTLAFAPFTKADFNDSLPALPASAAEVRQTKGRQLLDTAATKNNFLRFGGDYEIVHLATHAVVRNEPGALSYVVFSPEKKPLENLLYTQEIYNLQLRKTSLVILSACETGAGSLVKGEGVLSLSRAFAYAGCANAITSLWTADDVSTAYITSRTHRYLGEGLAISQALQKAKRDYLADKSINPRLKQPYYWAHLIFVGNYSAETKGNFWWWMAGAIAIVAMLVMLLRRKQKARR